MTPAPYCCRQGTVCGAPRDSAVKPMTAGVATGQGMDFAKLVLILSDSDSVR